MTEQQTPTTTRPEHQNFNIGVKALLFREEKLLLFKRHDHNVWEMPGGRINVGDGIEDTLLRELSEELPGSGEFSVGNIVHAQPAEFSLPNGNRLMLLFLEARAASLLPAEIMLSPEHASMGWFARPEFEALELQPQVRAAGLAAFRRRAEYPAP